MLGLGDRVSGVSYAPLSSAPLVNIKFTSLKSKQNYVTTDMRHTVHTTQCTTAQYSQTPFRHKFKKKTYYCINAIHFTATLQVNDYFLFPSLYILFNTIPPCPTQTAEGTVVKEEERRKSTFHERYLVHKF